MMISNETELGRAAVEQRVRRDVPGAKFTWREDENLRHQLRVMVGGETVLRPSFARKHLDDDGGRAAVQQLELALRGNRAVSSRRT